MTEELSVFRSKSTVSLMILCRCKPPTWSTETLVCRALLRSGKELLLIANGEAIKALGSLRLKVAYEVDITNKCLKNPNQGPKMGVNSSFDIRFQFAPKYKLAAEA